MDVKYIGGDVPWTLPFGDHFNSSSQASLPDTYTTSFTSASDLETIARRHGFEPLYSENKKQSERKSFFANDNLQWMNSGILFTDKTIPSDLTGIHKTDFSDNHGHTFCYLCSINQHDHERTQPRDQSQRRKLIPYNNPKALKIRPSSADRTVQDSSTANLISYRFVVRTGRGKNSGTRAQVFLYMYGTETNWTSINLRARANQTSDGFPSGSIRTVCLKGPDIGQLHHLNVNLVGARSDKAWFLKEIEITNLNTSVTWLCEFNCWLPKTDGQEREEHHQIKPTTNPYGELLFDNLSVYILQVRTGGKRFAGTDSNIQVTIRGSTSQTRRLQLASDGANLFERNQLDTFAVVGWDIGDLLEIIVESDRTQFASDWDLKEITAWKILPSNDHELLQVYFPFNTWLEKKGSTIKAKGETHSSTDHRARGPTCYQVVVKTGKAVGAGTDANVFLIIYGSSGRTGIHQLDNSLKNDFERDATSEFTIMDIDVGKIDRIKIWHDNSKPGAAWFLDTVIIRKKHSTCRPITDVFIQRLEQISKILYIQAYEQLKKNHEVRISSTKENEHDSKDRRSSQLKDYDDLGNNRSILRSPIIYDKANLHKKVTWDEHSIGSQDEAFSNDTKRMKNIQKPIEQTRKKSDSALQIESGHFDHRAYWISSHNYNDNKWQIKSIEERNSLNLDKSMRSTLLSDRLAISSKIKTSIHEKDDDVYEFEANRWLAKDKNDGKLEIYLTPKAIQLSAHTTHEIKSKLSSDTIHDSKKKHLPPSSKTSSDIRHDDPRSTQFDLGPLHKSPRNSASLDRSPHGTSKTLVDESRSPQRTHHNPSSTLKLQEESLLDKYQRPSSPNQHSKSPHNNNDFIMPSAVERERLARTLGVPSSHSRTAAASLIDTRSSESYNQRSKSPGLNDELASERDPLARTLGGPSKHSRTAATSFIDTRSSESYNQRSKSVGLNSELASERERSAKTLGVPSNHSRTSAASLINTRPSELHNQHSKSPRNNNDLIIPPASERELSARISGETSPRSRPPATPLMDTRPSELHNQRSKSTGLNNELASERDLMARTLGVSSNHSRTAAASLISTRPSELHNQHSKSPRNNNDLMIPSASERELSARISGETSYRSRPPATPLMDTRSSELHNQRSKPPVLNNESTNLLTSNRDLSSRVPADPPMRPKSAARPIVEPSSQRPTRNQVYSSAYGTTPNDNF